MALSSPPCTRAATNTLANHGEITRVTESPKVNSEVGPYPNPNYRFQTLPLFDHHMWFGFAKLLDCCITEMLEGDAFFGGKIETIESSGPKLTWMIVMIEIQQRNICKIILSSIMPCLGGKDERIHA
uniref:Uncharacterized protein n=1 Tax=Oryza brachyantha TaxID=4533 RepID=J3LFL9_ORYBR